MANKNMDLKEVAYNKLLDKIINCEIAPGSFINEARIAEAFGLSRTPVREAVSRLQKDGYLKVLPKKGIQISEVTLEDALQIFQARIEVEPITIRMAIPYLKTEELLEFRKRFEDKGSIAESQSLDTEMHLFLIDHCQNKYLIEMMHKVFQDSNRVVIATKQNEVKIHDAKMQHIEILNSLINKDDPEVCADLMRRHVLSCRTAALNYFASTDILETININSHSSAPAPAEPAAVSVSA